MTSHSGGFGLTEEWHHQRLCILPRFPSHQAFHQQYHQKSLFPFKTAFNLHFQICKLHFWIEMTNPSQSPESEWYQPIKIGFEISCTDFFVDKSKVFVFNFWSNTELFQTFATKYQTMFPPDFWQNSGGTLFYIDQPPADITFPGEARFCAQFSFCQIYRLPSANVFFVKDFWNVTEPLFRELDRGPSKRAQRMYCRWRSPVSLRLLRLACLLISGRATKQKRPCERHHRKEMMQRFIILSHVIAVIMFFSPGYGSQIFSTSIKGTLYFSTYFTETSTFDNHTNILFKAISFGCIIHKRVGKNCSVLW